VLDLLDDNARPALLAMKEAMSRDNRFGGRGSDYVKRVLNKALADLNVSPESDGG
jgi:hypothetical protein